MSWLTGFFSWVGSLFGVVSTNTDEVVKIQAAAVRACGFLPTMETVLSLMAVVVPVPGMSVGTVVAKKICFAVNNAKKISSLVGDEELKPMIDGVVIEGEFVNG
jgi:hypothetical protein